MTTRREVLTRCGAGLTAIIAAGKAPAAVVRGMLGARGNLPGNGRLPYARKVKYLQTSGTQYIDTLFFPTIDSRIEIDILCLSCSSGYSGVVFRGNYYNSNDAFGIGIARTGGGNAVAYFGNKNNITINWMIGKQATIILDRGQISAILKDSGDIKTAIVGATSCAQSSRSLYLLNGNTNTADLKIHATFRLYGFKIYESSELIMEMLPVINYNEEPCLYDKVSGAFFYNAGTGRFLTNEDA